MLVILTLVLVLLQSGTVDIPIPVEAKNQINASLVSYASQDLTAKEYVTPRAVDAIFGWDWNSILTACVIFLLVGIAFSLPHHEKTIRATRHDLLTGDEVKYNYSKIVPYFGTVELILATSFGTILLMALRGFLMAMFGFY